MELSRIDSRDRLVDRVLVEPTDNAEDKVDLAPVFTEGQEYAPVGRLASVPWSPVKTSFFQ